MDVLWINSGRCFINLKTVTSGIKAVFLTHKGTKINIITNFEQLNVGELIHEFHQVVLLSPLKKHEELFSSRVKDICGDDVT